MTLLVRDERDIVEEHLAFHLAAGVDEVIVTDHASTDGTEEILARYESDGRVRVLREPEGPFRQREWVTGMARLAATEHGADWVINGDADEFWWPRGGSLQEVLAAVPRRYGIAQSFVRHFVPVRDDGRPFHERMTLPAQPDGADQRPCQPVAAVPEGRPPRVPRDRARRGRARRPLRRAPAAARLVSDRVPPLPSPHAGAGRAEGARLGRRGREVLRLRGRAAGAGDGVPRAPVRGRGERLGRRVLRRRSRSRAEDAETGVAAGLLAEDTRVRDAIRVVADGGAPTFPRPSTLETAAFAVEAAVLAEADVVRTQRWLDDLERRLAAVERRAPYRAERALRRLLRRGR